MSTRIHKTKCLLYESEAGLSCVVHARLSQGVKQVHVDRVDFWEAGGIPVPIVDDGDIMFLEMAFNGATHSWKDYDVQTLPSKKRQT